ncbi:protein-tyrosine phosphatase domain-containing protein [Ditylenchus destructor]|uniref:Protein-tyrosine phosphatase domain-containing protein n=1 Tax=Ditylenchus destructor TaxID=166010 RepID=A0AAD4R9L3_9BILA|nr:protein-tyrosine phosphatase domain-containing protein [Ditylenchus destructor]
MNIEPAKPNTPKPQRNHHSSNRKITANVGSAAAVAGLAAVLATTAGGSAAPQPQHHSTEDEPPHSPNLPPKARGSISRPNAQKQMGNSISIGNHANIHRKQSGMVVGNSVGLGLSQPNATGGRRLSPNNKLFLDVPTPSYYQQSNSTERVSLTAPVSPVSTPSPRPSPTHPTSSSPLSSLSRELKQFRKRSLSEISLILEIIRGATAAATAPNDVEDEEGSPRRQRRIRTASPRPSTSASLQEEDKTEEKIIRRISLSAGNLSPDAHHGSHSTEGRPSGSVGKGQSPTATLSRISSFLREHRKAARRIRWERLSPQHIQKQMDRVQEEKAMQMAPTAPIDASRFVAYVQERRKKRILFKGEYLMVLRSIDPQKCTTEVGIRMGDKNQYSDTLPYDYNRVILEPRGSYEDTHGISLSDYINASYVQSWLKEKAYVVTQAVKTKQASNDFWRCIWELRANCIVMLTKVFDFMRVMCLQYWPIGRFQFGEIDVETLETKTYGHFVIRTFRLKRIAGGAPGETEETRIVKHFHFTEWELNSFPYISAFIELRRRVRQWTDGNPGGLDGPVVVHCRIKKIKIMTI